MSETNENNESIQNSEQTNQNPEPQAIESANPSLEAGVERLIEVIDRTVQQYSSDPNERILLRDGITSVVRETLQELALSQGSGGLESLAMGLSATDMQALTMGSGTVNSTTEAAINAASTGAAQVGASFVSFTQGLITGTFKAIIDATIQQMQAYSAMVAELTKSLKEFASTNIDDDAVNVKLAELTFNEGSSTFDIAKDKPRRFYHLQKLYALAPETGRQKSTILGVFSKTAVKLTEVNDKADGIEAEANTGRVYTDDDIKTIQEAVRMGLAKDGMNQLRQMAREGMARIIVTEGEIHTKLTFSVKSDATATTNSQSYNRSQVGVNAKVSGSAGWGWGRASTSLSTSYDNLSVNTVSENAVSNINTSTDMLGEVRIKFKTDYQPLNKSSEVDPENLKPIK
jgi:hypothetical protein